MSDRLSHLLCCVLYAFAVPLRLPRCYIRFHPDPQEQQQHHAQQAATVHGACSAMCSSPMAKLGSPNLQYCESAASPHSTRPRSAGSVCQLQGRWQQQQHEQSQQQQQQQLGQGQHNQLAARRPPSPLRGSLNTQMWQQQGLRSTAGIVPAPLQQHHHLVLQQQHSGGRQSPCQDIAAAAAAHSNNRGAARTQLLRIGAGADECAAAAAAGGTLGGAADKHTAAAAAAAADDDDGSGFEQQQHHADERGGAATDGDVGHKDGHGGDDDDEVLLYGELMSALRRGGGGSLRSEAILEQLLQELGAARAALSAERGEARALKARLKDVEEQHAGCGGGKKELQVWGVLCVCMLETTRCVQRSAFCYEATHKGWLLQSCQTVSRLLLTHCPCHCCVHTNTAGAGAGPAAPARGITKAAQGGVGRQGPVPAPPAAA